MIQSSISSFVNSVIYILIWLFAGLNQIRHLKGAMMSNSLWLHGLCDSREACQTSLSFTISHKLLRLMSIELVMSSNHLILCHPLLLLPSIFPSNKVFPNDSVFYTSWPKYWSFRFRFSPSNEYSELISFTIDWLDLLAVQGTLNSLQHHSSKASILQRSAFLIVQLSHPYMTTGKNHSFD